MVELIKSATFEQWLTGLRDVNAVARIQARLDRMAVGNPGDAKPVGAGISEMRIAGGDKSTQARDIRQAKRVAGEWRD